MRVLWVWFTVNERESKNPVGTRAGNRLDGQTVSEWGKYQSLNKLHGTVH